MSNRILGVTIVALWLAGVIIATFSPITIISDHKLVGAFVSLMSWIMNSNGHLGDKSQFSEVTVFYHSVVFLSLPFWLIVLWRWASSQVGISKTGLLFKEPLSFINRLSLLLLVPLWLFLAYAAIIFNNGQDTRLFAFGSSRLMLGLFGMAIPLAIASSLVLAAFSIKRAVLRTSKCA
jgi:hypothetical protein